MSVLIAITSCDFFEYTFRAAQTALQYTPDSYVMIIDDASEGWPSSGAPPDQLQPLADAFGDRVGFARFDIRFGLTRSWNQAVTLADLCHHEYTVISNNDVIFTNNWWTPLESNLNTGFDLVGPVTNAPGPTAKGLQLVDKWIQEQGYHYSVADEQEYLNEVADKLGEWYGLKGVETRVNGFCFAAKTSSWLKNCYRPGQVFNLRNTHNSKGQSNPTPTMTLMEDEYQHRLYAAGGKAAVCPGSFVFHYRSVWRGDKYARMSKGQILRRLED